MVEQSELHTSWSVVASAEGMDRAAHALAAGHGPIGVDAERASGFTYRANAYLIQASRRGSGTFLFDPTEVSDFAPLQQAIGDVEWIFHAASQDLACLAEVGLVPSRIFDTELATRLLGFERVGLGSVVERLLGITLQKAHSAADWSTRPLPEPWLEYAALDVELLPDLRDAVSAELLKRDKEVIAFQEFEAVRTKIPKLPAIEPWRKFAGGGRANNQRTLAMARELWVARDTLARERDVAPGRLFPDASLLAAVKAAPRSPGELSSMKSFHGRASRSELPRWWAAILLGKTTDDLPDLHAPGEKPIPHHRGWAERYPAAAARLAASRTAVEAEAETRDIPIENLLTPDLLRRLAWAPPAEISADSVNSALADLGARPWQREATSTIIAAAFVDIA
jgi:ribonuclease D